MLRATNSRTAELAAKISRTCLAVGDRLRGSLGTFPLRSVLLIWAFWFAFVHYIPAFGGTLIPNNSPKDQSTLWPYYMEAIQTSLTRWDSKWFHDVVERGYYYRGPNEQSSVRFYPFYPLLIRFVKALTHLSTFRAGTFVSAAAALGAMVLLGRAAQRESGAGTILPTVEALLLFPSAFVLATVYSESTTLFLFLLAIHMARTGHYLGAGLAAFAAGMSRINGFLILLPLAVIAASALRQKRGLAPVAMLVLGGVGVLVFPAFLWWKFGDPLLYFHIHAEGWSQTPTHFYTFIKDVLLTAISHWVDHKVPLSVDPTGTHLFPVNFAVFCCLFWALRASILKRKWDDVAFMVGACLISASAGNLLSVTRIALIYYPIYLRLGEASVASPTFRFAFTLASLSAQAILLSLFVRWVFVF